MKLTIVPPIDALPADEELADMARSGIEELFKNHLLARNDSRPSRGTMPKSSFYAHAAESVTSSIDGNVAEITIGQKGVALHYYGGVILPTNGRKALAIPKHPAVHDEKPSTFDPSRQILALVWQKGKSAGVLKHKETNEVYFLLIPRATIPADETVLPTESATYEAAAKAMESIL